MTTAVYLGLEQYLESLEGLPVELQQNLTLIRDLDSRVEEIMKEIDQISHTFLRNARGTTIDEKKKLDQKIQSLFGKAKEYADNKVKLADQTYELMNKHIQRLDSDLARFESEIKNGGVNIGPADQPRLVSVSVKNASAAAEKATKKGRKREQEPTITILKKSKTACASMKSEPIGSSGKVLDMPMPVDPNEPIYCICHQVSFGEMIACDNPDCTIEWFHISCMGLSSIPKGKWYCPRCQRSTTW